MHLNGRLTILKRMPLMSMSLRGVHLIDMYPTGIHLIDMHLTGVHLMDMPLFAGLSRGLLSADMLSASAPRASAPSPCPSPCHWARSDPGSQRGY